MLDVTLITSFQEVLFSGKAEMAIFPGDSGIFEVLPYHKSLLSRLLKGTVEIDEKTFAITRGVVKVDNNKVVAIVERE